MNALLNAVSNLGGNIAGGMGDIVGGLGAGLGEMIGDPSKALGLDYLSKLFDDPEEFQKYLMELEMEGQSRGGGGVGIPRIDSLPPMSLPTGGFVGQNPQFMNTDQLILRGE